VCVGGGGGVLRTEVSDGGAERDEAEDRTILEQKVHLGDERSSGHMCEKWRVVVIVSAHG
jgi:hypothetical protein